MTRAAGCDNSGRLSCDARMHYMRNLWGSFSNRPRCGHGELVAGLMADHTSCALRVIVTPRLGRGGCRGDQV